MRTMRIEAAVLAALGVCFAGTAEGTTLYWDGQAGDSNWATNTNWDLTGAGGGDPANAPGSGDVAQFNAGTNVNYASGQNVGGINFNGGAVVFNGAEMKVGTGINVSSGASGQFTGSSALITLGSDQTWLNDGTLTVGQIRGTTGSVAEYALTIDGPGNTALPSRIQTITGLTKQGTGTLTISAANLHTTGLTLKAGRVNINNISALGTNAGIIHIGNTTGSTAVEIDNTTGSTVTTVGYAQNWNQNFTYVGASGRTLNFGSSGDEGSVTLVGGSREVTVSAGTLGVAGAIGDGGNNYGLIKSGGGTLSLASANTFTGGVSVKGGTLRFSNLSALGSGTLSIGDTVGAASVTVDTTGIATGTLSIGAQSWNQDFTFTLGSPLNMGTGAVTLTGGTRKVTVSASSNRTLTVDGAIGDGGNGYGLVKDGSRPLALAGANTYTGDTTVQAGNLTLSSTGSLLMDINTAGPSTRILGTAGGSETLSLNGTLVIDARGVTADGTWQLVDVTNITPAFHATTFVMKLWDGTPFTQESNVWTLQQGGTTYEFREGDGQLIITGVPEPSATGLAALAGIVLIGRRCRKEV